jgi:hypothetical protein
VVKPAPRFEIDREHMANRLAYVGALQNLNRQEEAERLRLAIKAHDAAA